MEITESGNVGIGTNAKCNYGGKVLHIEKMIIRNKTTRYTGSH